jgi:protein-disulfide isomerase
MKKSLTVVVAVACFVLFLPGHAPGEAQAIRWNQIIGADQSRMNDAQRTQAAALLRSEFCYFGCSRTIARCLEASTPNRTARRLAGFVVRQVLAGRTDAQIREGIQQRGLSAHPLETVTIDLSNAQCIGPENAPVTVVEYADFQCPFCRVISPIIHDVVEGMSQDVRFCFKHFPVRGHQHALPTSIAALAAERQGRFWQMHDALYASAPRLSEEDILRAARTAGIPDMERWSRDRQDASIQQIIESDKREGIQNGVRGTPTIFVNGKELLGRKNEEEIRDRLEEELDIVRGRA